MFFIDYFQIVNLFILSLYNYLKRVGMKKSSILLLITIISIKVFSLSFRDTVDDKDINKLWLDCKLEKEIPFVVFNTAMIAYYKMNNLKKKDIITIVDFSKPSTEKRFYVINIESKQVLYKDFVAHGKNTGENYAKSFSNKPQSLKSSLGLFVTAETYHGKHGYSLKLDGLEKENNNARAREIVIHGADYVSQKFIDKYGRLGRSWGCPALPLAVSKEIIDKISGGSCLFIYGIDETQKKTLKK